MRTTGVSSASHADHARSKFEWHWGIKIWCVVSVQILLMVCGWTPKASKQHPLQSVKAS